MTAVKGESSSRRAGRRGASELPPRHIAELTGRLLAQGRAFLFEQDWGGLRVSHFRLLSNVPPQGISITELATAMAMTKQGCGQFVRHLTDTGHVQVRPDPDDRRTKLVHRTRSGDRVLSAVEARIALLEQQYAEAVGPRRYAQFRRTLEDLTAG